MKRYLCALACSLLLAHPLAFAALDYSFLIDTPTSGLDATLTFSAQNTGTLIGNYDPLANPTGTRTKPGLFGTFGSTENLPVNTSLDPTVKGNVLSSPTGSFQLSFDFLTNTIILRDLNMDLLSSSPIALPVTARLTFDSFRTRNPTSTYFGASINAPLGDATVSQIQAAQAEPTALGTLTPLGQNRYAFAAAPLVTLTAQVSFMDTDYLLPTSPLPIPLAGEVTFTESGPLLSTTADLDLSRTTDLDEPLDPFEYPLPTLFPMGDEANVIFNLTLKQTTITLAGTQTFSAAGTPLPAPATLPLLAATLTLLIRRRPRSTSKA